MSIAELEREFLRAIERDLTDVAELEKDPMSNSIYLFFLSRNKIQTSYIDNLIDWANTWVQSVLSDGRVSKFADRDITSAVLDLHSLKELRRSLVRINPSKINSLLDRYVSHCLYFGDITHTCLILASLSDIREQISTYEQCLQEVIRCVKQPEVLNDPKNLVFAAILLKAVSQIEQLRYLCSYALSALQSGAVQFADRIYYAWTLWSYREFIDKIYASLIRSFTEETIDGLGWNLSPPGDDILDVYGSDLVNSISKIQLSISLDLVRSFNQEPNLLAKIPPSALLMELKVEKTKSDTLARRNFLLPTGSSMTYLVDTEQKLKDAETRLNQTQDVVDLLGEAMEKLCRAYLASQGIPFKSLSGLELHDKVILDWKQKSQLPWTDLKFQTGVRHILRIWAMKKHNSYESNSLESSYLLLLAWRGYQEILCMIDQSSREIAT